MRLGGHMLHVREAEMGPVHVLNSGNIRLVFNDTVDVENPLFVQLVLRVQQPFFPFRVGWTYGPVEGGKEYYSKFFLRFQHCFNKSLYL